MVLKYNPDWTGGGIKRYTLGTPEWSKEFFEVEAALTYDINVPFTRETWRGRMMACRGIGASELSESEIAEFEKEHVEYLNTQPENFDILHYVTILNLRKK